MGKETVIGEDFESYITLLWCQWNAREINADEFVRKVGDAIPPKLRREKWNWYNKQRKNRLKTICQECGKEIIVGEKHTYEDCLKFKQGLAQAHIEKA